MKIDVMVSERVFVVVDGVPVKYLGPGRHRVWEWFKSVKIERVATNPLLAELDASRLALVPAEDLSVVTLGPTERAVVYRKGKAALWLAVYVDLRLLLVFKKRQRLNCPLRLGV